MRRTQLGIFIVALVVAAAPAMAVSITNGALTVDIDAGNGAIGTLTFGGRDWYNPGVDLSDYGFQLGADTSTFALAETDGSATGNLSISSVGLGGGGVVVLGQYTAGGAAHDFVRHYTLVAGQNVLRVYTAIRNKGDTTAGFLTYDTADPDQGVDGGLGFETLNDRVGGGQILVASASSDGTAGGSPEYTTVWGLATPAGFGTGGFGLGIGSGSELNSFFATGGDDPNGSFADTGMSVGNRFGLAPGAAATSVYFQSFGRTPGGAGSGFDAAIPEPSSLLLLGAGIVGLGVIARRRRKTS